MENKKYYEILGIDKNASESEIKRAYKQLAKEYHPDHNHNSNAKEKFIELNNAYRESLNPTVPKIYGFLEIWEEMINKNDFWNIKKPIINAKTKEEIERQMEEGWKYWEELEKNEEYQKAMKNYHWTQNKLKLLNRLSMKLMHYNYYKDKIDYYKDKIDIPTIINHFQRVLNYEVGIKEKINKPIDMKGWYKIGFNIQNQFHPKFLNKFPMKIQIFLRNKMRNLIKQLSIQIETDNNNEVK